ncbi:MAG: hypothetical protein NVSMB31_07100 [Vulcanimicrobiaceae bacterium]
MHEYSLGRFIYGFAAIAFGICAFAWHDISNLHQSALLSYIVGSLEILGGAAILWRGWYGGQPRFTA